MLPSSAQPTPVQDAPAPAFRILHAPASIGAGETTDTGYVNQRGVLACRAALVDELYSPHAGPEVIRP